MNDSMFCEKKLALTKHLMKMQNKDFLTELCCNTIIHLLFQYFLVLGSLNFQYTSLFSYDCSIRVTAVLEYI